MEKRIIGIILTVLGVAGLILAGMKYIDEQQGQTRRIVAYAVLGLIFFLSGVGMLRNTHDRAR